MNLAAAMHLDLASRNFGLQEENHLFTPAEAAIFPGSPVLARGYLYPNDRPGLGLDIAEELAVALLDLQEAREARFIAEDRRTDGSVVRP